VRSSRARWRRFIRYIASSASRSIVPAFAVGATDRDSEARGELQLVGDALCSSARIVLVRLGEDDGELVAADSKGVVSAPDRRAECLRHRLSASSPAACPWCR